MARAARTKVTEPLPPPETPPCTGYGWDAMPKHIVVVDPAGSTVTRVEPQPDEKRGGWWVDIPAEHVGKNIIVTRRNGDQDLFRVPVTPGTYFDLEDEG